jgi:hypothetical protein
MPSQTSKILPRFYKTLKSWAPLVGCVIALNLGSSRIPHFCLVEMLFNLHCPFCGLTHACELFLQGRLTHSLEANLLAFPFAFCLLESAIGKHFLGHAFRSRWLSWTFSSVCVIQLLHSNGVLF